MWQGVVGVARILSVISEPLFCLGDPAAASGPCVFVF